MAFRFAIRCFSNSCFDDEGWTLAPAAGSPVLLRRPHVEFERPGPARLFVQEDETIDDPGDADQAVLAAGRIGKALPDLLAADRAIHHDMADVNAIGGIFLRHRL